MVDYHTWATVSLFLMFIVATHGDANPGGRHVEAGRGRS